MIFCLLLRLICSGISSEQRQKKKFPDGHGGDIFRLVIVGRKYNEKFLVHDYDKVAELLDKLEYEFPIDLLIEDKKGNYGILYFDIE